MIDYAPPQRVTDGRSAGQIWQRSGRFRMCGFLLSFIPGHLLMVLLHGWNNFYSMLTGWKRDPEYLS
jgi:thiosulfate reductase cytochrome b subunit